MHSIVIPISLKLPQIHLASLMSSGIHVVYCWLNRGVHTLSVRYQWLLLVPLLPPVRIYLQKVYSCSCRQYLGQRKSILLGLSFLRQMLMPDIYYTPFLSCRALVAPVLLLLPNTFNVMSWTCPNPWYHDVLPKMASGSVSICLVQLFLRYSSRCSMLL